MADLAIHSTGESCLGLGGLLKNTYLSVIHWYVCTDTIRWEEILTWIKGGVSDFWYPMLIFEITKTNTPLTLPQKVSPYLIAPPHTYIRQRLVLSNKTKPKLLTYREETKQPLRPIAGLPLLQFSPALESWSHIYTSPTSCFIITPCLLYTGYYRTHYNQWCCLHWMPCRGPR